MKTIIILLMGLFFVNLTFSQEKMIKITDPNTDKGITIKENRRIRIKTTDGQKISGRFRIFDDQSILIKSRHIQLSEIEKIKRNPLMLTVIIDYLLIGKGAASLFYASLVLPAFTGDSSLYLLAIPASGLVYAGIKSPNFLKGYKKSNGYIYEIITPITE